MRKTKPTKAKTPEMAPLRRALIAGLFLLPLPTLAGGGDLPSLGDASSAIVSPAQEYQLGHAFLNVMRGQIPRLSDPLLKDYVERSVSRLAQYSQVSDKRFEFILLRSPELNAFAAPGGIIGVNGGMFLHAKTEAQYASVLAHELSHLSQRHFARGQEYQRSQMPFYAAMLAGLLLMGMGGGGGDAAMATLLGSQAAMIQGQLHFSRENEEEADRIGLQTLQRAGYDPQAMPDMFTEMAKEYRYGTSLPEYLQSHPVTATRIAYTQSRVAQMPKGGKDDSLEYQLVRARCQLLLENPAGSALKQFRALLDKDPQSDSARYGLALAQTKVGKLKEAENLLQPLLQKDPNNIYFGLAQSRLDQALGRLALVQQRLDRLNSRYPDSYPVKQSQIDLLLKQKQPKAAKALLEGLVQVRPRDPDVWYQLSEARGLAGDSIGVQEARAEYFALTGDYDQALQQLDLARRRAADDFPRAARLDARYQTLKKERQFIRDNL